jgi:hypothetical protein
MKEARRSFLKKRTKKLFLHAASGGPTDAAQINKSFFATFFSKKVVLTFSLSGALPWRG